MTRKAAAGDPRELSLHDMRPDIDEPDDFPWGTLTRGADAGLRVSSHFGDVKTPLTDFIRGSQAVVGCVAWLTDFDVLDELARVDTAIIVQKEDFLRPDMGVTDGWKQRLRDKYSKVTNPWMRHIFPPPLNGMSTLGFTDFEGVRCVGNHNAAKKAASPRMHHKFLVRLRPERTPGEVIHGMQMTDTISLHAQAVWTGSFNFTRNAGFSFENALIIHDEAIAHSYLEEFSRVAALSEQLDWTSEWVMPQWRMGT